MNTITKPFTFNTNPYTLSDFKQLQQTFNFTYKHYKTTSNFKKHILNLTFKSQSDLINFTNYLNGNKTLY